MSRVSDVSERRARPTVGSCDDTQSTQGSSGSNSQARSRRSCPRTCSSRSTRPTSSRVEARPARAVSRATSALTSEKKCTRCSTASSYSRGLKCFWPAARASSASFNWLVMPTWQVPVLHSPQLDAAAQARADERAVGLAQTDLDRQARVTQGVFARGARAAVVAADGDDVGARLRHARRDGAEVRDGRDLDRDFRLRVDRLQLLDDLREVFDGVDVVVVRRRDEVDAGGRVSRLGDARRYLEAGEESALAGLGALPDLDLQKVARVEQARVDAEPSGGDLLP